MLVTFGLASKYVLSILDLHVKESCDKNSSEVAQQCFSFVSLFASRRIVASRLAFLLSGSPRPGRVLGQAETESTEAFCCFL